MGIWFKGPMVIYIYIYLQRTLLITTRLFGAMSHNHSTWVQTGRWVVLDFYGEPPVPGSEK
jgi:hypothetical protein